MFNNDLPKIIRGRTAGSQNLLHLGFRYSKSGKLTQDGRQAWRCVKKDDRCPLEECTLIPAITSHPLNSHTVTVLILQTASFTKSSPTLQTWQRTHILLPTLSTVPQPEAFQKKPDQNYLVKTPSRKEPS